MISHARLLELLSYDPLTGFFAWRQDRPGHVKAGDCAGSLKKDGYISINVDGRRYKAHRLAWFYVHGRWPNGDLDHRSLNRAENWIANLREGTRSQNMGNIRAHSGLKGVSFDSRRGQWRARIKDGEKERWLGYWPTADAAHAAYTKAAADVFGEFARAE